MGAPSEPSPERIAAARAAGRDLVRPTPLLSAATVDAAVGRRVVLKAENLQRTGAFKLRGAVAKLAALGEGARRGVVAGSAGNHALALACAARAAGVHCDVFMPADAPVSKVDAARRYGATVHLDAPTLGDAVEAAEALAGSEGLAFVHPFDDLDVVAGQATVGLELLEAVDDLAAVVVPLGGGGLLAGIGAAVKRARPEVRVVGVQAAACAAFPESLAAGRAVECTAVPTIADGIAVKRPGRLTLPLVERFADSVEVVTDDEIAEAMVLLLEESKVVVEGAGAVAVAAVLAGRVAVAAPGTIAAVLSGGNVDATVLAAVVRHHETLVGRSLVLVGRMADRPGELARLLTVLAQFGVNVVDVSHVREGIDLGVRETAVQIVVETRDPADAARLDEWARDHGFAIQVVDHARAWRADQRSEEA
ncbi:MAG TPA: pyridoxal-phosphate dependent enzyme [Acidimicrobiia bacterium]|nr:pyridoxal-phosphate dependent enzyme [Acidimicrobiia bacterium]